jgi:hypothetical protein
LPRARGSTVVYPDRIREIVVTKSSTAAGPLALLLACLILSAPSLAQGPVPAGGDQYAELIPDGGGQAPTKEVDTSKPTKEVDTGKDGVGAVGSTPLPASDVRRLGRDAAAAAELAAAMAPTSSGDVERGEPASSGGSAAGAVSNAATAGSSGGMGVFFPLALAAPIAALLLALLLVRSRSSADR